MYKFNDLRYMNDPVLDSALAHGWNEVNNSGVDEYGITAYDFHQAMVDAFSEAGAHTVDLEENTVEGDVGESEGNVSVADGGSEGTSWY